MSVSQKRNTLNSLEETIVFFCYTSI